MDPFLIVGRNALGWILGGQPFSTFLIGSLAAAASFLILGPPLRLLFRRHGLGWIGLGVILAVSTNLAQLFVVDFLFIRHNGFFFQIPAMLLWSALSGAATAVLACKAAPKLEAWWDRENEKIVPAAEGSPKGDSRRERMVFFVSWIRLVIVLLLTFWRLQILMFVATSLILMFRSEPGISKGRVFIPLLKSWPLFLFQGWLHLFAGEGVFLAGGLITQQGLAAFGMHAFQLGNVLLIGPRLAQNFPYAALQRSASPYFQGFGWALAKMPSLLAGWTEHARAFRAALRQRDLTSWLERLGA